MEEQAATPRATSGAVERKLAPAISLLTSDALNGWLSALNGGSQAGAAVAREDKAANRGSPACATRCISRASRLPAYRYLYQNVMVTACI
jgi:hypothetical protein